MKYETFTVWDLLVCMFLGLFFATLFVLISPYLLAKFLLSKITLGKFEERYGDWL